MAPKNQCCPRRRRESGSTHLGGGCDCRRRNRLALGVDGYGVGSIEARLERGGIARRGGAAGDRGDCPLGEGELGQYRTKDREIVSACRGGSHLFSEILLLHVGTLDDDAAILLVNGRVISLVTSLLIAQETRSRAKRSHSAHGGTVAKLGPFRLCGDFSALLCARGTETDKSSPDQQSAAHVEQ